MKKIFLILSVFTCISAFAGYDYDGQTVFFREGQYEIVQMPWVKRSEFTLMDGGPSGIYGKDKNHVYVDGRIVPDADPKTAVYLGPEIFKDKNFVYKGGLKMLWPDATTFEHFGPDKYSSLFRDKFSFYKSAPNGIVRIDLEVYPDMDNLHTRWVWLWDEKNTFVVPYFTDYIEYIPNLHVNSMSNFLTIRDELDCVIEHEEVYCPTVLELGDGQVTQINNKNINLFMRLYSQGVSQQFNNVLLSKIQKKITLLLDTQEKREIFRKKLEDRLLIEMKKGQGAKKGSIDALLLLYDLVD